MKNLIAKNSKHGFGRLIDLIRTGPAGRRPRHGLPVVVAMAVAQYDRLSKEKQVHASVDHNSAPHVGANDE